MIPPATLILGAGTGSCGRQAVYNNRQSRPPKGGHTMRRASSAVVLWFLLCQPGFAQTLGTITGEVKDSSGAVVPGATVTVVNKATNATRTTTSNTVGLY